MKTFLNKHPRCQINWYRIGLFSIFFVLMEIYSSNIKGQYLTVSPTSILLDNGSDPVGMFTITSNTTWSITDDASWFDVTPVSGTNNGNIIVFAESANPGGTSRSGTVTIEGTGVSPKTVTVTQPALPYLAVSPTSISLGYDAGSTGTFNITSNTTWSITDNATWLTVSPESGTNNGTETVTATSANTGTSPRSAAVRITGVGVTSETVTVTQAMIPTGCINETFTAATGTVTDNSGSSNYGNNMTCSKLIQPTGGGTIALTFTSFATEAGYDIVRVYDGATTSSPLMGTYSGSSLPPVLTSTGGSMLITFTTDGSVTAAGWSATYAPGTTGGCINETFTAATGTVTDNSGSSNYGNNMSCSKLIQPTGGSNHYPYIHFICY